MSVPKCPNHNEPLMIEAADRMKTKGRARCPVSKVMFAYTQDVQATEQKKDKFGNVEAQFIIEGND